MTTDQGAIQVDGLVAPEARGEELRWFEAAARHELLVTRCRDCAQRWFPLRALCPSCGSRATADEPVSGNGVVHSFTIQHRRQRPEVPIPNIVALVDLAEGPRLMSRLEQVDPGDVYIGMPVEVRFASCGDLGVPVFVPERGPDA